jgi:uncharacterized BrkB/YihY/UPF0761 family membrane protein
VLAWEERIGRRPRTLRDGAVLSTALLLGLTVQAGTQYLRAEVGLGSLALSAVAVATAGGLWLGISLLLPHAHAHWRALVPGALLFAFGVAALHVATVYYLAPKLARAPALYGSLGTASVLLLWLYLLARVAIASAFVNVVLWRRAHHDVTSSGQESPHP